MALTAAAHPSYSLGLPTTAILAAGYFLCGIGMTLPIDGQAAVPILGFVLILLAFFTVNLSDRFAKLRAAQYELTRRHAIFFLLSAALMLAGIPGLLTSAAFGNEYLLRNLAALVRIFLYIGVTVMAGAAARVGAINTMGWLTGGVLLACLWNFYDFFSGRTQTNSLAGQNMLGICVSAMFPFVLVSLFRSGGWRFGIYFLQALVLLVAALLTWSKGAWINMAVTLFAVVAIQSVQRGKYALTLIVSLGIGLFFFAFDDIVVAVFSTELSASEGSASNEMRLAQLENGLRIFLAYPLGVGNTTYPAAATALGLHFPQTLPPDPHNSYVHVLVGFGYLGFLAYFFSLIYVIRAIFRMRQAVDFDNRTIGILTIASLFFQGMFSGELFTQPLGWIIIGHILGMSLRPRSRRY